MAALKGCGLADSGGVSGASPAAAAYTSKATKAAANLWIAMSAAANEAGWCWYHLTPWRCLFNRQVAAADVFGGGGAR